MTLAGTDDYLQGGLVAWTSADNYAKVVAMRAPQGAWVIEFGRRIGGQMVCTDNPTSRVPLRAAAADRLQRHVIQGRSGRSTGATSHSIGAGSPSTGLVEPQDRGLRLQRHRQRGRRLRLVPRRRDGRRSRHVQGDRGRPRLPDPVRRNRRQPRGLEHRPTGMFTREADCTSTPTVVSGCWHSEPLEDDYSSSWTGSSPRTTTAASSSASPTRARPWVAVNHGYESRSTPPTPDRTTGAVYTFQCADLTARTPRSTRSASGTTTRSRSRASGSGSTSTTCWSTTSPATGPSPTG